MTSSEVFQIIDFSVFISIHSSGSSSPHSVVVFYVRLLRILSGLFVSCIRVYYHCII